MGDGTYSNSYVPRQVLGLPPGIVQVAAGSSHSLAVAADGTAWAWGSNRYGELGNGRNAESGEWSRNVATRVSVVSGVRQVAAGMSFSVALRTNGEVWTWGRGDRGQLGNGSHDLSRPTPARANMAYGMIQVAAGDWHAMALRPGSLWAWGDDSSGQLGNGTTVADSATAVLVDRRTSGVTRIDAGGSHNLALDAAGSLWAWGDNTYGALGIGVVDDPLGPFGHGRNVPLRVPVTGVGQISAGVQTSLVVLGDGGLLLWGLDLYGVLGDGTPDGQPHPVPTRLATLTGLTQAAVDGFTVLAIADAVTVPNVIGEIRVLAVARLQAAGLTVQVVNVPDDPICNHVGEVVGQNPTPGQVVPPGTRVRIQVAIRPRGGCF